VTFFSPEFLFRCLKVVRKHGGIAGEAANATIAVLKDNEMKLSAASWDFPGNLADSPEQSQLLQQPWCDSTADITYHDGFARFDSEYMSRIHTHTSAANNDCPDIR